MEGEQDAVYELPQSSIKTTASTSSSNPHSSGNTPLTPASLDDGTAPTRSSESLANAPHLPLKTSTSAVAAMNDRQSNLMTASGTVEAPASSGQVNQNQKGHHMHGKEVDSSMPGSKPVNTVGSSKMAMVHTTSEGDDENLDEAMMQAQLRPHAFEVERAAQEAKMNAASSDTDQSEEDQLTEALAIRAAGVARMNSEGGASPDDEVKVIPRHPVTQGNNIKLKKTQPHSNIRSSMSGVPSDSGMSSMNNAHIINTMNAPSKGYAMDGEVSSSDMNGGDSNSSSMVETEVKADEDDKDLEDTLDASEMNSPSTYTRLMVTTTTTQASHDDSLNVASAHTSPASSNDDDAESDVNVPVSTNDMESVPGDLVMKQPTVAATMPTLSHGAMGEPDQQSGPPKPQLKPKQKKTSNPQTTTAWQARASNGIAGPRCGPRTSSCHGCECWQEPKNTRDRSAAISRHERCDSSIIGCDAISVIRKHVGA